MKRVPIIAVQSFIQATRDTGYKSTASAIAELIDNALEAEAKHVQISIVDVGSDGQPELIIRVTDDGVGMSPDVLRLALQFGGSTRFGSRTATGRYGMGLPNGGLSQARCLEVLTWTKGSELWRSYLDVDKIASDSMPGVPLPSVTRAVQLPSTPSGTMVVLRKCDRLDSNDVQVLEYKLAVEFGRIFRKFLYAGTRITINGRIVRPIDPLFVTPGANIMGANFYGTPIEYKIRVPKAANVRAPMSVVSVIFSELPIAKWHHFSNEKKNELGISKGAGVSIVRAGREIDYGWYFMGAKRKENYDDWWRCEVAFHPELDELFGVTHSKQKINPTELLSSILTPEIERIARELNNRARKKYASIKSGATSTSSLKRFQVRDYLLEPPGRPNASIAPRRLAIAALRKRNEGVAGLGFSVTHYPEEHNLFFAARLRDGVLSVNINECHPFYSAAYKQLWADKGKEAKNTVQYVLLLLISFARTECVLNRPKYREIMRRLRQVWSDTIAAFLS